MKRRRKQLTRQHGWESLEARCVLDSTVVFNEIMYHPPDAAGELEFVELYNQMAVDMDISSWSLADGVQFSFPEGTIIPGGGYLVVAKDPAVLQEAGVRGALGPYEGRLANGGERLELWDRNDRVMDAVTYDDEDLWPLAPDGGGTSLAKRRLADPSGPVTNWVSSVLLGGTPGRSNFGQVTGPPPEPTTQEVITEGAVWRYLPPGEVPAADWTHAEYDDRAWQGEAPAELIGYWPLDGDAAAVVGIDGSLVGSPVAAPDRLQDADSALAFNGVDQYVSIDGGGGLDGAAAGTLSLWVQWNGRQDADCCGPTYGAVTSRQSNGQFSDTILALDNSDPNQARLVWRHSGGPAPVLITSPDVVGDGTWHHVVVTFDESEVVLYLDGTPAGSSSIAAAFQSNPATPLAIGAWSGDGGGFASARVDDVAIWNRPLSAASIQLLTSGAATPLDLNQVAGGPYYAGDAKLAGTQPPILTGVTASASSALSGQEAEHVVDGSGLNGLAHAAQPATGTMWLSNGTFFGLPPDLDPEITFDLGQVQRLETMRVWNYNNSDTASCCLDRGLAQADIWVAGDDGQFELWIDDQVFQKATGSVTDFSQQIDLRGVDARYVKLDVDTSNGVANYGDPLKFVGLSEVQFLGKPIPGKTELTLGPTTYYFRREFDVDVSFSEVELLADLLVDDGAVVYLNGVEVYRHNLPPGPVSSTTLATAEVADAAWLRDLVLPADAIRDGRNVLAVEVHQARAEDADFLFGLELTAITTPLETSPVEVLPILINEVSSADAQELAVELVNAGDALLDIGGLRLVGSGGLGWSIPAGTTLPGHALQSVRIPAASQDYESGDVLYLADAQGQRVFDAVELTTWQQARVPDGGPDWYRADSTIGSPNTAPIHDEIVINEIMYHHRPQVTNLEGSSSEFAEDPEEWIELFNRSAQAVNLAGWRLGDGIDYEFPSGTSIPAGGYLVVARDADALRAKYPDRASLILGNFERGLDNTTDRILLTDAVGNPADMVRYYEDGQWPAAADGRGSSLELQDPDADNSVGLAWAASVESDDAPWRTYTYSGVAARSSVGPDGTWNELVLGLLSDGEILLDDISVIQDPNGEAIELIQNGSFQQDQVSTEADTWRIIGNHRHSEVIVDPDDPSNQVLRFVATSATEHMHNHAETTLKDGDSLVTIRNGVEYQISFRAKWITGSNLLNSRLYFNRLARTTAIEQPAYHGTPGRMNSVRVDNLGPTYTGMIHQPAVPQPMQPVTISVQADDPDGVASMTLWYSIENGAWNQSSMTEVQAGFFEGQVPGQTAGRIVQFYVEGEDATGIRSTFPRHGADSRALFKVDDGLAATNGLHNLRMIVTPADASFLHNTVELMSNDRVGATIIYDEQEIFYDAGLRLSGSQRARPYQPRLSFSVGFNSDQLFRGVHSSITLDRSESTGFGQRELIYHHGMSHAGGLPSEYNDLFQIITPQRAHTGTAEAQLGRYSDVFLDSQYESGSDGQLYEYELTYFPTTTDNGSKEGRKRPQPDDVRGTPIRNIGDSTEDYRWVFLNKNNRNQNDYSRLIEFATAMGAPTASFNDHIGDYIDVDQWLRAFAFSVITGHGDNYGSDGSQHNLQLYVRPSDNRVLFLPHDLDAFFDATRPIVGNGDLRKLIRVPENEHMYYGHVYDMIQTTFNEAYMSRWTEHFGSLLPGQRFDRHLSDLVRRSDNLLGQLRRAIPEVEFAATSPTVTTSLPTATLSGTGWVDLRELRRAGSETPLEVNWTTDSTWEVVVDVPSGSSDVTLYGFDFQGQPIGEVTVTVTSNSGDLNGDGQVDAQDIDQLCNVVRSGAGGADLNGDLVTDLADVTYLVEQLLGSTVGDANLDGAFNSADLVLIFQAGKYEDGVTGGTGWAEGDWDCDGEFTSQDLVAAFQVGAYSAESKPAAEGAATHPELADLALVALARDQVFGAPRGLERKGEQAASDLDAEHRPGAEDAGVKSVARRMLLDGTALGLIADRQIVRGDSSSHNLAQATPESAAAQHDAYFAESELTFFTRRAKRHSR